MLLLRKEVSVSTSHVLKKLCAAHRKWLQNPKSLLGETIWSNMSSILRFHENLKSWANFVKKSLFRVLRPHDKNLDPTRTFAVRRLRGSPLACTVARYLIRVLTGARRKRIRISLKNNYPTTKQQPYIRWPFFCNLDARGRPSSRVTAREARRDGADPHAVCGQLNRCVWPLRRVSASSNKRD